MAAEDQREARRQKDVQAEEARELSQVAACGSRPALLRNVAQGAGNQSPLARQKGDQSNARYRLRGLHQSRFFILFPFTIATRFGFLLQQFDHIGKCNAHLR